MRSNKKQEHFISLIGRFHFDSPTLLSGFDLFLEARAEIKKWGFGSNENKKIYFPNYLTFIAGKSLSEALIFCTN